MKVVFVNLDVGSAIEQSGKLLLEITKEVYNDVHLFSYQTKEEIFYKYLLDIHPDLVIVNGEYPRILTPLGYYKLTYPSTKLIYISRVFTDFIFNTSSEKNLQKFYYEERLKNLFNLTDHIIIANTCKIENRIPQHYKSKVVDCCGINDPNHFTIKVPGDERINKFLIFGSLNPHKLSSEFLDNIKNTDISIDAYGFTDNQPEGYKEKFDNCKNLNYKGYIQYENIPDILNEYKYYLLPHNGREPLNNALIQAILCGCIPIVFDDYKKTVDGNYGLKGGKGLYFGCDNMNDYINAIKDLYINDINNGNNISTLIRNKFICKYGDSIKKFKDTLKLL